MGKYTILFDDDSSRTIDDICAHLVDISNELSEHNRLKRIELNRSDNTPLSGR